MKEYEELIEALQCASHFALYQDCYERNCYANSRKGLYCNIPKLMADAADALEAAEKRIDNLQQTCDKLASNLQQAQLPKDGEWIYTPLERYKEYKVKCPFCGAEYHDCYDGYIDAEDMNYCPNCGAKMRGERNEQ